MDDLLFLDVINEDFREQSKLISILISSLIQQSPLLNIYEEKKKLLLECLDSQRLNEKNLFRDKLVSVFVFCKVWFQLKIIFNFRKFQKVNDGIYFIDFSSNIHNIHIKRFTVLRNHLQKWWIIVLRLATLLDENESQLNVTNTNEISIGSLSAINEIHVHPQSK